MNFRQHLTNPVLNKEFRVRMRSNKTPWIITFYLFTLGFVLFFMLYTELSNQYTYWPSNIYDTFIMMSLLQYGLIIFATPGLTAGAICGERERQTLPILLTTNLSSLQIVLGKWISALSFMLLLVFASLPIYGTIVLFGGVALTQIIEIFGVYLVTMLSIGAVGICVSTLTKRTGVAAVITYSLVFAYTALLNVAELFLLRSMENDMIRKAGFGNPPENLSNHPLIGFLEALDTINPASTITRVFTKENWLVNFRTEGLFVNYQPYGGFILWYLLLAILMLGLAAFFLRRRYMK
ncbi:ABC transporter permease subunit [Aneurinibacillus aneurinilyticus]|uniref:ABC transporter permease n=1 Tax=Aneurinibacillus aneurinilyticus TaxID=1391 RepID=UPI0023F225D8|nr:ABC transporter permease subunit [Aneurinibacillus aneurinilyticus]MED0670295.1 ABC transporter permease subunit [Aneurinibacillus aneurinilyticus]